MIAPILITGCARSGTSLVAAEVLGRKWLGIELSPNYCEIAKTRVEYFKTLQTMCTIKIKELNHVYYNSSA